MFRKKGQPQTAEPAIEFEAQLALQAHRSKRVAWAIAVAAFVVAVLALSAVNALIPLKQTVPYLIYVDKASGLTQVVDVANPSKITSDEVNAKHWVARYVQTRERYLYQLLQDDFDFSIATSDAAIGKEYARIYQPGPNKKDQLLRDQVEERIRITAVQLSPSQTGRATVRYLRETIRAGSREPDKVENFIADLAFRWSPTGQWTERNRLINPLGFTVTAYRTTAEVPTQ